MGTTDLNLDEDNIDRYNFDKSVTSQADARNARNETSRASIIGSMMSSFEGFADYGVAVDVICIGLLWCLLSSALKQYLLQRVKRE